MADVENHDHTEDHDHDSEPSEGLHKLETVAVHMALLPTEKVIVFSGADEHIWKWWKGKSSIWDPDHRNKQENPELSRNLFCAGHCMLPDGRVLVAGGQSTVHHPVTAFFSFLGLLQIVIRGADHDINIFDPQKNAWNPDTENGKPLAKMPKARWYPTCVTLPDGKALIVSGISSQGHYAFLKRFGNYSFINEDYEIFDPKTNNLSDPLPFLKGIRAYPFLQILPGGTLFVHFTNITKLWNINERKFYPIEFKTKLNGTRTYDGMGSCVLLPIRPEDKKYRVLLVGGSSSLYPDESTPATNQSEIFEFDPYNIEGSEWRKTKHPTNIERFLTDSVLLPNGTVLATNGAKKGISDHNHDAVKTVEIFDPITEIWTKLDEPLKRDRLYHGTAVLLPKGEVLVAGSTGHDWPPSNNEKYVETITPSYLKVGPNERPSISDYPQAISYNSVFQISTDDADSIHDISLIRISSTTHNNNMDQRCLFLEIQEKTNNMLKIKSPKDGTLAPPGYYIIFLLNEKKVPSEGKIIKINSM